MARSARMVAFLDAAVLASGRGFIETHPDDGEPPEVLKTGADAYDWYTGIDGPVSFCVGPEMVICLFHDSGNDPAEDLYDYTTNVEDHPVLGPALKALNEPA